MKRAYVEEMFEYKGYKCACVFNAGGFRCGYVAIDETHPYYSVNFMDDGPYEIQCHWGLTYSGEGKHFYNGEGRLWWLGFDCGHYKDLTDYDTAKAYGIINDKEYSIGKSFEVIYKEDLECTHKDKEFIKENCKMIVEQLIAVTKRGY